MKWHNKETIADTMYREIEAELQYDPDLKTNPTLIPLILAYQDFIKSYYKGFTALTTIMIFNDLLDEYNVRGI